MAEIDGVESMREVARFLFPFFGQRDVGTTGVLAGDGPCGFTVANEEEAGRIFHYFRAKLRVFFAEVPSLGTNRIFVSCRVIRPSIIGSGEYRGNPLGFKFSKSRR